MLQAIVADSNRRYEHAVRTIGGTGQEVLLGAGVIYFEKNGWDCIDIINDDFDLCYITAGQLTYQSDEQNLEMVLEPGSIFQRFPGVKHSTRPNPNEAYGESYIKIPAQLYSVLVALGTVNPKSPILKPGLDTTLIDQFRDIFISLRQAGEPDLPGIVARMHQLVVTMYRLDKKSGRCNPYALTIMHACSLLSKIDDDRSIPDILGDLPMSYERFRKIFAEHLGVSPGEYRIRRKIDRARELLLESPEYLSVKEVADRLGYPDGASFAKQFKERVGKSPDAYRRTTR